MSVLDLQGMELVAKSDAPAGGHGCGGGGGDHSGISLLLCGGDDSSLSAVLC